MRKMKNRMRMILGILILACFTLTACGKEQGYETAQEGTAVEVEPEDINMENENGDAVPDSSVSNDTEPVLRELAVGDVAPEFSATLADGSTFTFAEKKGKVILLNFWATWCGPCVGEMPAFQDLYEEYGEQVEILAVNCMEEVETVNRFIEETGYQFPIAYDVEGKICMAYPSSGIPYTLVIGTDGTIKKIYVGAADAQTQYQVYKAAIDAELAE